MAGPEYRDRGADVESESEWFGSVAQAPPRPMAHGLLQPAAISGSNSAYRHERLAQFSAMRRLVASLAAAWRHAGRGGD
jgi:hypothetical protein